MWARLSVVGALVMLAAGLGASLSWGALAIAPVEDLDDSTLLLANRMTAYGFGSGMQFGLGAFIGFSSLVILASGVLWRWLGALGLVLAVLNIVGALWVVDGDQEGLLGVLGIIGFIGFGVWTLATSVGMLRAPRTNA